ncbi:casein kinase II, regulatory subunit [Neocallimastix lanati (nom. inval.)]|jgi:casein kinase II subunit beta|uniref:Casein kinase II subunit beta n=1 Tax=Neocallimastix californiae TaxID=1754190 RepID=A0A1Y2DWP5_9FUNG|nr:casein kinase II, regulatory subunit [Neocallimastix sp. JGI-2020a]ORY63710.1 hypothetical protein LY90DRAFT_700880 [Neocallimastix californiae]|eukprot:ORY63710.1 hypothetical protein LY90DRAFT_700880 [Neocallimastix californiae]
MEVSSGSDYTRYWLDYFLSIQGHELFCEVEESYILDRFNLTGLNTEVEHFHYALQLITDSLEEEIEDANLRHEIEKSAVKLYGLIHARYIITNRGLARMVEKFRRGDFGKCPRVLCQRQHVLPVGLTDVPFQKSVRLYCPRCEDIYFSSNKKHNCIDGAFFGTTFPHLLLQVYPQFIPIRTQERYVPKIFGFKIHEIAEQHRKQDEIYKENMKRIEAAPEE